MTDRHLNPSQSWQIILSQAQKAFLTNDTWESPKQKRRYRIKEAPNKNIVVSRNGQHHDSIFGERFVIERINQLNASNGIIARQDWDGHVAKMAAIVHLHPQLNWQDNFETIIAVETPKVIYEDFGEAPNDNPEELSFFARKVRRGQRIFRDVLLKAYANKCCVTHSGVVEVLQACHISPHSLKGENKSENGLLLRSDIHDLFDSGLIYIEPQALTVNIHPQLRNSEYWQYNGKKILSRIDGKTPRTKYLTERWTTKEW